MSARTAYLIIGGFVAFIMINIIGSFVAYRNQNQEIEIVKKLSGEPSPLQQYLPRIVRIKDGKTFSYYFADEVPPSRHLTSQPVPQHHVKKSHHYKNHKKAQKQQTHSLEIKKKSLKATKIDDSIPQLATTEPFFAK